MTGTGAPHPAKWSTPGPGPGPGGAGNGAHVSGSDPGSARDRLNVAYAAACAAHWCGLLAVKLAPGAYATRAGETKREETKKDR